MKAEGNLNMQGNFMKNGIETSAGLNTAGFEINHVKWQAYLAGPIFIKEQSTVFPVIP